MAQEKRAQGKNGTGNNATKCMIGKNGTSLFQLSKIDNIHKDNINNTSNFFC